MPAAREAYVDENGDKWVQGAPTYFLRLVASNGGILARSETYSSKSNARRAAQSWIDAMEDITHEPDLSVAVREVQA